MKRPRIPLSKIDIHSLGFQTKLELAVGAVFTALLLRWLIVGREAVPLPGTCYLSHCGDARTLRLSRPLHGLD